jgi:hypothetical protein
MYHMAVNWPCGLFLRGITRLATRAPMTDFFAANAAHATQE